MEGIFKFLYVLDFTTICIIIITFLISAFFVHQYYVFKTFKRIGIPGPAPILFFGNYFQLDMLYKDNGTSLMKLMEKHGKVLGLFAGSVPKLVVADIDIAKEILIKEFSKFCDRPLFLKFSDDLISKQGEEWKRIRYILSAIFSARKLKQMSPIMNKSVGIFMEMINKKSKNKEEFDIYGLFQGLTMQVIGECVFALEVDSQRDPNDKLLEVSKKHFQSISTSSIFIILVFIPWFMKILNIITELVGNLFLFKHLQWLIDNFKIIINERKKNPQGHSVDMLQFMLDVENDEELLRDNIVLKLKTGTYHKTGLSESEIIGNSVIFLLAGYETTSVTLAFCAYNLAKYPNIQKEVQEEIDKYIDKNEKPDYNKVNNLQKLDQLISETLRLYPPISNFVTRLCVKDCQIGNYILPQGLVCEFPVIAIHRDPDYWEDPDVFNPDRFSPENKANIKPLSYLPFGGGPRNCIGMRFALLEIKVALACLLRDFTLIPGEKFEEEIEPSSSISINSPKNGIWIKAVSRN